ncbi:1-pyrroline-5-carboxylate dehydrogenase [Vibrio panuliri]|uniref:1-pyrroline-5-carboxylate dehydrogenase n=1 Tax=Vibrio panuliri TaxID=1381081 RepID=A0ABX3FF92_9VIBR|nr:1-pyrroline-5-carboxylate dehydrogenase [Vibrio panuliri]KAB1458172.1 1-pyrroline-5-carboxylate dehydrogenase [Vibrio panuliri]OLQ89444.1 1-pyrroline-5-carboxylate dehydrogenase [Vibrio panuliri]
MVHHVANFTNAFSAWENWNLTDFESKSECLLSLKASLQNPLHAAVVGFHLQQAEQLLSFTHQLVGPTGETNELYTAGRGVTVIAADVVSEQAQLAIVAQCTAALIAGNSVIVCSDDSEFTQNFEAAYQQSSLPTNLMHFASFEALNQVLESDVRAVGFIGSSEGERSLNRQLAARDGAIVALVSETDLATQTVAHDPHLSLRFITERTRTINITAVGGNATLLGAVDSD